MQNTAEQTPLEPIETHSEPIETHNEESDVSLDEIKDQEDTITKDIESENQ